MAFAYLMLALFVSAISGFYCMKKYESRTFGLVGAGTAFVMSAGPAWLMEVLKT